MHTDLRKITFTSLSIAIVFVCTVLIVIPLPIAGYINLGDAAIYLTSYILGPNLGLISAGLGSMLGDLHLGFASYALATFIIKGCMGAISGYCFQKSKYILGVLSGMTIMVLGYYLFEVFLLSSFITPLANVGFNLIQGCTGSLVGFVVVSAFKKVNLKSNQNNYL